MVLEHHLSQQCLSRNDYQYGSCQAYFENYRRCKKFWGRITAQRRRAGITPYLPTPEERPPYLLEYAKEL
ncbi:Cysteine alpha-hairpin motif superfamily [Trinorchestia longiramus]|nr:Cysteine alpha-hairpin motif superfamily [Trinorchestia longiramus]